MDSESNVNSNADEPGSLTRRPATAAANASKARFCLGVFLLLLVDIIWVASSELSRYVYSDLQYDKPYLSTYLNISLFSIFLLGFLVVKSWRKQCFRCACDDYPGQYLMIGETDTDTDDGIDYHVHRSLSKSTYVPAKYPSDLESSDTERRPNRHRVKFNEVMEVRHLEDTTAAQIARMPYLAALRARILLKKSSGSLTVTRTARLSCLFAIVFFAGNVTYLEALTITEVAVVNVMSSSSSFFTLLLSAIFPTDERDKFTICKFFAVLSCMGGVVLVSVSGGGDLGRTVEVGALWALVSAMCYAVYLVFIRRVAGDDLNVPMFFAFVGVFTLFLLWPGLLVLHYTGVETFELPDKQTAIYLTVNGLVGTVLSELLWLWGCMLTTSLVGTLSLSLTIPLSVAMDIMIRKVSFTWRFFAGAAPVFLSFIVVTLVSQGEDAKPCCCCCKNRRSALSEQEIPLTGIDPSEAQDDG